MEQPSIPRQVLIGCVLGVLIGLVQQIVSPDDVSILSARGIGRLTGSAFMLSVGILLYYWFRKKR